MPKKQTLEVGLVSIPNLAASIFIITKDAWGKHACFDQKVMHLGAAFLWGT